MNMNMNMKYIRLFTNSFAGVFSSLGFGEIAAGPICLKDSFICQYNLTVISGISGSINGNVAVSMHYDTAKKIASTMMMGLEVAEIDAISVSALGELTNMICGQAAIELCAQQLDIEVTPPTVIHGDKMKAIISQVETTTVALGSVLGQIELNLGLTI